MDVLEPFLNALRPLLRAQGAEAAHLAGSCFVAQQTWRSGGPARPRPHEQSDRI